MDDHKSRVTAQLKQTQAKQSLQLAQIDQKVSEYMDLLGDDNMQLQELYHSDSNLLIFMNKKVDELYNKTVEFSPEIDLKECLTSLNFDQNLYEDLENRLLEGLQVGGSDRIEIDLN